MGIDLDHGFEELLPHVGHELVCVNYGIGYVDHNVAIECNTCGCVLIDFDNPEKE